ncbi:hypothetical protein HMPREF0578_0615 [Mobiluncus mulieris 28-1]|nr:hypothetical protein HMPREF0577_1990 [Mobiluncus mulieris ATCC 35243]EEZ90649.1 hypothetical protein HMPREF0578_0615 [Mobiluncus mulieris 28-1]EFN94245.1 hypothetical protein HMPREF9278_0661 [Mobiluncus mulieris FB024-16]
MGNNDQLFGWSGWYPCDPVLRLLFTRGWPGFPGEDAGNVTNWELRE